MTLERQEREINIFRRGLHVIGLTPIGAVGLGLLAVLPLVPFFKQEYLIRWLIMGCFLGASAMAFDFSSGYMNILNFGFMAFLGLGAYTSSLVSNYFGLSPWVGLFLGILPAALMGFLTGVMSLRLRGLFAVFLTWFFGLALMGVATKWVSLTRGPLGLRCPRFFSVSSNLPYFYLIVGMLFVSYVILKLVIRSNLGLAFRAIGQNLEAAQTSGIFPTRYRILNFTISCGLAGWLGGFYAHYYGILTPDLMSTSKVVEVLVIAYIGGRSSLWGGALAAIPFVFFMEIIRSAFSNLPGINLVIYGLFLIFVMIYYPGGLAHLYTRFIASSKIGWVRRLINADMEH